ncbi:MAG: hypothetical protein GY778_09620 [bacterium]|nr:hypothetical protein [bacterium]
MVAKTQSCFPEFEDQVKDLVGEHKRLKDQPLLLAVYYAPDREPHHVFLLEVIEQLGSNNVDQDRELFEVTYGSTPAFPLASDQRLHLILTNPTELRKALEENWSSVGELRGAKRSGRWKVIACEDGGRDLEASING